MLEISMNGKIHLKIIDVHRLLGQPYHRIK